MCCEGKCLFFIPVKTGSFIFGYVIAVISALGTIAFAGLLLYSCVAFICASNIILVAFIEFLSSFICSVLLLVGISKNKPSFVVTFIIYGMIQVVLLFVFFIMLHCMMQWFVAGFLLIALAFIGIYALCIYMVFLVYQQLGSGLVLEHPPVTADIFVDLVQLEAQVKPEV